VATEEFNGDAGLATISADGRYMLFTTNADNAIQ
jgi:hypothetical protein